MAQARAWCFTAWTEEDVERVRGSDPVAFVVGREVCPETGKEHFQGYVRWRSPKRFAWWKTTVPTVHVEVRKGTEVEAAEYCRKDGNVLHDFGVGSGVDGSGELVDQVCDLMESGAGLHAVYSHNRRFFFHNHAKIAAVWRVLAHKRGDSV